MLKQLLKENMKGVVATILIMLASSAMMVYAGYSLTYLFSAYSFSENQVGILIREALKVAGIWLGALGLLYLSQIVQANTVKNVKNCLREKISLKIVDLSYREYVERESGNYVSWLTNDVEQITAQTVIPFFSLINSMAISLFSLFALIELSIYIGIVSIILFAFVSLLPQLLGKTMKKISEKLSLRQEETMDGFKESIQGFLVFRIYNLSEKLKKRIADTSTGIENVKFEYSMKQNLIGTLIMGINVIGQIILLVITIYMAICGLAPIGAVLSVGNLAGTFFSNVGGIVKNAVAVRSSGLIMEKFAVQEKSGNYKSIGEHLDSIKLENVSYSYHDEKVIESIDFEFKAGGKYAIVGESGCGKSTLAKIIMGFLPEYQGKVWMNECELSEVEYQELYRKITYMDQTVYLFKGTVKDNITLGETFSEQEIWEALEECKLKAYVEGLPLGLNNPIEEDGRNMSGGQRQRLALTRAMIRKVKYIIVDEGTSALDERNATEIEQNLLKNKELCTIIISHHLKQEIQDQMDQIYMFL